MEEILAHALYQINAQLNDKFPLSVKISNIKRIVKEAIEYYETYYELNNKPESPKGISLEK